MMCSSSFYFLQQVALYSMYVATMAFHAKVSDPVIGGTYMTLLNTVTNLGGNWPSTLALWLVDPLTSKECQGVASLTCGSPDEAGVSTTPSEGSSDVYFTICGKQSYKVMA